MNIKSLLFTGCFIASAIFAQSAESDGVTSTASSTSVVSVNATNIVNTVNVTNVVTVTNVVEQVANKRVAAIFVINNLNGNDLKTAVGGVSERTLSEQTDIFRNSLSSRLAGTGFRVVNPDVVLETLKKAEIVDDENLYSKLQEKNTAQQLADLMGADYLIIARLLGLGCDETHFEKGNTKTDMVTYTLYTGYEVITGSDGASFMSGAYEAEKKERTTGNRNEEGSIKRFSNNKLLSLYSDAAGEITKGITKELASLKNIPAPAEGSNAYFKVECTLANVSNLPLVLPLFWINNDGSIGTPDKGIQNLQIYIEGVEIEVDGILLGTADDILESKAGLHSLTVSRTGMKPVKRLVNFKKNRTEDNPQVLKIALQPTAEEMQILKENIQFYQDLLERNKELDGKLRLNEAYAKDIEGHGKMLARSGYRVDAEYRGQSPYDGSNLTVNQVNRNGIETR